jgi:hypothetical protein
MALISETIAHTDRQPDEVETDMVAFGESELKLRVILGKAALNELQKINHRRTEVDSRSESIPSDVQR